MDIYLLKSNHCEQIHKNKNPPLSKYFSICTKFSLIVCFKQGSESRTGTVRDHWLLLVPLYGQTPTAAKRNRQFNSCWHSCPNTTLCKVFMSVESIFFLMKSSEGDRQKERVPGKKTVSQSNKRFLCEELPAKRNGAHASQVQFQLTGDRPAWCYTLGSPAHLT